MQLLTATASPK